MTSWLSSDGRRAFLLAALFFALAATVRYEGWVLGGCFFLIAALRIIGRRRGLKERAASLIPAAVILLAFPLYWAGSHLRDPQGTLGFLHSTAQQYLQFHAATLGNLIHHNPAVQFLVENSRSMTLVGLIPVAGMVSVNERVRTWVLVPGASLVLISACSFFLKGMPSHDFWRVPAAWGVLLLPFTAYWIVQYGGGLMRTPHTGRAFLLLLVLIPSLLQCKEMTRVSELTRHELALGRKLDQVLTEGGSETERRVLLETSSWKFIHVLVASQHPFSFVLNTGKYADAPRRPILNPAVGLDIRDLAARGVRFLVFKSQAYISLLDEAPEARRMGDFGLWVLYRLEAERDPWDRAAPQRPGRPSALTGSPAAASLPAGH